MHPTEHNPISFKRCNWESDPALASGAEHVPPGTSVADTLLTAHASLGGCLPRRSGDRDTTYERQALLRLA